MKENSADTPKIEGLNSTVTVSESNLTSSQTERNELKEKLLAASKRSEESASEAANAKQAASDLRSKLEASEKKSKALLTAFAGFEDTFG